jgi:hypothetical protein
MANYILLERITVGAAGASSVTFSNIPQTGYTDLLVKVSARGSTAQVYDVLNMSFNGTSTFNWKKIEGSGSAASSASGTSNNNIAVMTGSSATANTFGTADIYIPNYTSSGNKSVSVDSVSENNATTAYTDMYASLWTGTGAITQISFTPQTSPFAQYSTFSLYALAAVGTTPVKAPKAIGGDIIQTDGTYWYHAFLSSGSFTPQTALSCDVLVVAGGGGAGYLALGAPGGAGGLLFQSNRPALSNTNYAVSIGAGGATPYSGGGVGANGTNSTFDTITALGGGGGGGNSLAGIAGGSGGAGGANGPSTTISGGAATQGNSGGATGYGNAGGSGYTNASSIGTDGGGGGAGAAGTNGVVTSFGTGGNGGNGLSGLTIAALDAMGVATSTGQLSSGHYYYAGGGAGAAGGSGAVNGSAGLGGGGAVAGSGTPNTGGGAGGSPASATTGGSGVVIIRYAY